MKKSLLRNFINIISAFAIISQSITPYAILLPQTARAEETQETTVTPDNTSTQTSDQTTVTPDNTSTDTAIQTPSATDTVTPTPNQTGLSSDTQTVSNNSPPQSTGDFSTANSSSDSGLTDSTIPINTTTTPTISPTQDGLKTKENVNLNITVLDNISALAIDLTQTSETGSAVLTTDKPDYAPTDTALITGTGLLPNTTYSLHIWSDDPPETSTTVDVTTDDSGKFAYAYQLDGIYRPNYSAELKDSTGAVVATTTFTDAANPALNWPTNWTSPSSCTTDPSGDEHPDEIDLVGDNSNPAVGFSSDSNYLYFRERVDGDPGSASSPHQYAWVVLFQTTPPQYQYLVSVNGKDDKVQLWQNTSPAGPISFSPILNDPAETKLWEGNSSDYTRITHSGSIYFVDWAIPKSVLTSNNTGITVNTQKFFATSADANNYNKDHLNCYNTGSIKVVKHATPQSSQSFAFTTTGTGLSSFSLVDDGTNTNNSKTFNSLVVGNYSITESSITGWTTTLSCVDNDTQQTVGTISGSTATLALNPGQNITCTYTNTQQQGSLKIIKNTTGGDGTFSYSVTGPTPLTPNISTSNGTGNTGFIAVTAGRYSVSETNIPSNWSLTGASCTNGQASLDPSDFDIKAGDSVICTFTNTRDTGIIQVAKIVDPHDDGATSWDFSINGPTKNAISGLHDGDSSTLFTSDTGDYTVEETGVDLSDYNTSYSCVNQEQTVVASGTGTISQFTLEKGQNVLCTFTNTLKRGSITVEKFTNPEDTGQSFEFVLEGKDTSDSTNLADKDSYIFENLLPGSYTLKENQTDGWDLTEASCTSNQASLLYDGNDNTTITLNPGENITCSFTNTQRGTVIVTKYNDVNGNGNIDDGDNVLSDWTIKLGESSKDTLADGTATFDNVLPGNYTLGEIVKTGWEQTNIICGQQEGYNSKDETFDLAVNPGDVVTCSILNHNLIPILTITKTNNTGGATKSPNDVIGYTITVTATQSAAHNVTVTDLLPNGFHYNSGSWKVVSSDTSRGINGDITSLLTEPTYHSPGVWTLGDIAKDETLTLTYTATIDGGQKAGTYYDNAWAQGYSSDNSLVLANAVNPGQLDSTFVGTQVLVGVPDNPSISFTQQVLGASTGPELPATGEPTLWVIIAALLGLGGFVTLLVGLELRKKYDK